MGKKAKVGKSRKDRFYHLAKETGFRARSAFKLIQLNRKFEFLEKSNVIIDLCAAPGGWLQVAAQNAPMSNHIIGIDLDPINPIKNVKTLQEDITTEKCRQALKKELHTVKADLVLNDGAPNVGKNWINDAFLQAELTLHALKLATEFLRKGGWFVTKLFRSKDYDSMLWIFQQLFKKVHATKPQASRNESAEIFIVCQNYIAPDKIDPRFLDPKFAFKDVSEDKRPAIDLIHPAKKRRQREGYPEGDYTLFYSLPASKYLASTDFMTELAESSEIKIDSDRIANHPLTTTEIKECLKDIRVLGKKDIKSLFAWRKRLKKAFEEEDQENGIEDSEAEADGTEEQEEDGGGGSGDELDEEEKELADLEQMLEEKNLQELRMMKKAKKKVKKAQLKQKTRIDLKMAIPGDRIDLDQDANMFDIKRIKSKKQLSTVESGDLSHMDADDAFEDSDEELPKPKTQSFDRSEKKYIGFGEDTDDEEEMEEEPMFEDDEDDNDDDEEEEEKDEDTNPLLMDLGSKKRVMKDNEDSWFSKSVFADLEKDRDENVELEQMGMVDSDRRNDLKLSKRNATQREMDRDGSDYEESDGDDDESDPGETGDDAEDAQEPKLGSDSGVGDGDSDIDDDSADDSSDSEESDYDYLEANSRTKNNSKQVPREKPTAGKKTAKFDGIEVVPAATDTDLRLDEMGLAIGTAMVQSRKRRREIIESGYHRFMYDDVGLPDWFVQDEKKHIIRQMPVTKEEIEEQKLKSKAIDAQPIKKIAEAKARKKKRMLKSLEKARKKANAISDHVDVSEKEKWNQIKHVYKKAGLINKAKAKVTYVVAKKGAGKKVSRPAGVKGKFKVVDGRMKKDLRGEKKAESRRQNGKNSKAGKRQSKARGGKNTRR